ncbi:MAG: AAA family ATPase [Defluviitaleaceae bacterium]|nr:AAA family ATPase [Defluviitaleaceae bacterium]
MFLKFLLIIGDGAVGKMTVGQELAKITDLRLFHNHMTIEPIIKIFGTFAQETILKLRDIIFEDFAASDLYGMIFTCMIAFDRQDNLDYMTHIADIFKRYNAEIFCAELIAPLEVRLERNKTENRLLHKISKRNLEQSEQIILEYDSKYRFISNEGEIPFENYVRIDNTELSAEKTALMIKEKFNL